MRTSILDDDDRPRQTVPLIPICFVLPGGGEYRELVTAARACAIRLLPHGPTRFVRDGVMPDGAPRYTVPAPAPMPTFEPHWFGGELLPPRPQASSETYAGEDGAAQCGRDTFMPSKMALLPHMFSGTFSYGQCAR